MAAIGASSSLPPIPAKVASPSRQRLLRLGDGNRSSCPIPVVVDTSPEVSRGWDQAPQPSSQTLDSPRPECVALLSGDYRLRTFSLLTFADFGAEPRVPNVRFAPLATNGGGAQPLSV